ncbi:MAG: hypothetical protein ACRC4W_01235 [Treponemataceae bacterium]
MKKLFSLTLICLLTQIYFVLYAQTFERKLENGGRLHWKNTLPIPVDQEDVDEVAKILETDDDYFEITSEVIDADKFNSEGYKQINSFTIQVKGQSQLRGIYNYQSKKIILDKQVELFQKINSFVLKNARQLQDNQYNRFINNARSYQINYTTNIGEISIFAGASRDSSDEVKIYYPIKFTVLDQEAQVYPNLVDKTNHLSLGDPYDLSKKAHLPAYFVYYMFNDHRTLFEVPAFNKSFTQY